MDILTGSSPSPWWSKLLNFCSYMLDYILIFEKILPFRSRLWYESMRENPGMSTMMDPKKSSTDTMRSTTCVSVRTRSDSIRDVALAGCWLRIVSKVERSGRYLHTIFIRFRCIWKKKSSKYKIPREVLSGFFSLLFLRILFWERVLWSLGYLQISHLDHPSGGYFWLWFLFLEWLWFLWPRAPSWAGRYLQYWVYYRMRR